ncbi:hypothetical protein [Marinicellulosiphila megalodicopiae]|uniref:hypothetical protein n=1 Tax=Marinicellulosiphila megalodicopiae TaxID=2724896 RepID=UPI003BAFB20D
MPTKFIVFTLISSVILLGCDKKIKPTPITNGFTSLNGKHHAESQSKYVSTGGILPTTSYEHDVVESKSDTQPDLICSSCHTGPLTVNELTPLGKKTQSNWITNDKVIQN